MRGFDTLFQPGYDHAGISTQSVVEKDAREGGARARRPRREAFDELTWDWLERYGGTIMTQFRRLGASLDYRRERFTMDDDYVRAVIRFFVHLWEQGLDLPRQPDRQLVPVPDDGALRSRARPRGGRRHALTIRYPLADGDGHITIATVPAGDDPRRRRRRGAPGDERYRDLVGRR